MEDRYQSYAEFRADVAALRTVEVVPASLWDRFRGWVVDGTINFIIVWLVFTLATNLLGVAPGTEAQPVDWRRVVVSLVIAVIVVGIPEGLRGASVGKWLVGVRVTGSDGGAPGLARGAYARFAVVVDRFCDCGRAERCCWLEPAGRYDTAVDGALSQPVPAVLPISRRWRSCTLPRGTPPTRRLTDRRLRRTRGSGTKRSRKNTVVISRAWPWSTHGGPYGATIPEPRDRVVCAFLGSSNPTVSFHDRLGGERLRNVRGQFDGATDGVTCAR